MCKATHQKHQTQQELTMVGPSDGLTKGEADSLFWGVWGNLSMDWLSGNIRKLVNCHVVRLNNGNGVDIRTGLTFQRSRLNEALGERSHV